MTTDDIFKGASALSLVIGLWLTYQNNNGSRRKDSFEELYRIIGLLKDDQAKLEKRLQLLEREKDELESWARRLVAQLQDNGIEPVPFRVEIPRTNE
jgi:hypothetical protein